MKEQEHEAVRLSTILDLKTTAMQEERQRNDLIGRSVEDLTRQLKEKSAACEKLQTRYNSAHRELAKLSEEVEKKEELLQSLQTGVASKEGQESGYQGQLREARVRASAASTEQEQAKLKAAHLERRVKEEEPRAKKAKEQNAGQIRDLDALRSQVKKLETELDRLGFEPGEEEQMYQEEVRLQKNVRELNDQADGLKRRVASIDFSYSDPGPNFDRSSVKGLVAQLFTLQEEHARAGTALEICAGGRLYNVVVDTAQTGTELLQKGKLKKRVTIIPLNKIAAFRASAEKIGAAQKLAPGKVDLALSLIGYDDEITAAMEYVFGSTLVCDDAETAKRMTFDPSVRMKSVTLEGDVYDPSGTLSGGSSPQSSGVLVTLQQLNRILGDLSSEEDRLATLQRTMQREKKKLEAAKKIKQELDLKAHEISLTEEQIRGNSASSIIQAVGEMKANITKLKEDLANAKVRYDAATDDVKRIEKDMAEFSGNKNSKLAELSKNVEKLKKDLSKDQAALKPLQKELQEARIESEQCGTDLASAQEQLEEAITTIRGQEEELATIKKDHVQVKDAHELAQAQLDYERAKLTGFDEELAALEEASTTKSKLITEESLEAQKLGHQIERFHKDQQAANLILAQMEREHEWISDEKSSFGRSGTPYDFQGQNMTECKSSLKNLTERFQGMKKKINPKVMNMIDSVEKKEAALKNMMKTVIKDKKKIEETITSLDEYKKEALYKTWSRVNRDFGQIFNELLPGSSAKLDPPEGKSISDGLEVKVCLGKMWKQSLTELSGGQRFVLSSRPDPDVHPLP